MLTGSSLVRSSPSFVHLRVLAHRATGVERTVGGGGNSPMQIFNLCPRNTHFPVVTAFPSERNRINRSIFSLFSDAHGRMSPPIPFLSPPSSVFVFRVRVIITNVRPSVPPLNRRRRRHHRQVSLSPRSDRCSIARRPCPREDRDQQPYTYIFERKY